MYINYQPLLSPAFIIYYTEIVMGRFGSELQSCYVLEERSAQLELDGYNFDTLHVVLEAVTSDTL